MANAHSLANKVLLANDCYVAERVILPQKERKEVQIPTEEEVSKLLNHISGSLFFKECLLKGEISMTMYDLNC